MSLLDRLEKLLLDKLVEILGPFASAIRALINLVQNFTGTIQELLDNAENVVATSRAIVDELKHFSLRPNFKSRVINGPKAIEHIQNFIDAIKDIGVEIRTLSTQLKEALGQPKSAAELEAEIEGIEDIRGLFTRLGPKLARFAEKLLGWLAILLEAFDRIKTTLGTVLTLLRDIQEIVNDVDRLNGIFLQQGNSRKTVKLEDGAKLRLRIGNLHSDDI